MGMELNLRSENIRHQMNEVPWKVGINGMEVLIDLKFIQGKMIEWIREKRWWSNNRIQETQIMEMLHSLVITRSRLCIKPWKIIAKMKTRIWRNEVQGIVSGVGWNDHQRMKAGVVLKPVLKFLSYEGK